MCLEKFDYIIVGAGSSGATLAHRLAKQPGIRVLILEAGPSDASLKIKVPLGYGSLFYDEKFNWKYTTESEPELFGRKVYWPRGKVLGGSSAINAMVYVRGHPNDYAEWSQVAPDWGWSNVLPYFKRMERWSGPESSLRGTTGNINVSSMENSAHWLTKKYLEAGQQLGFMYNDDYNGEKMEGVSVYQTTTFKGQRVSAATAYLSNGKRPKNIKVETNAHVKEILFDGPRAIGIRYQKGQTQFTAFTIGEIILSAGALNSPHLMMLSGLGPGQELKSNGINIRKDIQDVGANLQDHFGVDFTLKVNRPSLNQKLRPYLGKLLVGLEYLFLRSGPLAMSLNQGGGFVKSKDTKQWPDLQLYFSPMSYSTAPHEKRPLMSPDPYPAVRLGFNPTKPTSTGRVRLQNGDPLASPMFYGNYLSTDEDKETMLTGMHLMRRFLKTGAMKQIVTEELSPGMNVNSDVALLNFARNEGGTVFHQCGTCRMGRDSSNSVVDQRLRVHGIERLRIVDASIFPTIPTGNTNAPAIMVGEKAGDIILEDFKRLGPVRW